MANHSYPVEVQSDFLEKITRAKPVQAPAEFSWNSLDADASKVDVLLEQNELGAMSRIIVRGNGTGMEFEKAPELFRSLGGSRKRSGATTKQKGRFLRGQDGRGPVQSLRARPDQPSKHTVYILHEPTTGLHLADVERLLESENRLLDAGHTLLLIEHHLEVIKRAITSSTWARGRAGLGASGGDGHAGRHRGVQGIAHRRVSQSTLAGAGHCAAAAGPCQRDDA